MPPFITPLANTAVIFFLIRTNPCDHAVVLSTLCVKCTGMIASVTFPLPEEEVEEKVEEEEEGRIIFRTNRHPLCIPVLMIVITYQNQMDGQVWQALSS